MYPSLLILYNDWESWALVPWIDTSKFFFVRYIFMQGSTNILKYENPSINVLN